MPCLAREEGREGRGRRGRGRLRKRRESMLMVMVFAARFVVFLKVGSGRLNVENETKK